MHRHGGVEAQGWSFASVGKGALGKFHFKFDKFKLPRPGGALGKARAGQPAVQTAMEPNAPSYTSGYSSRQMIFSSTWKTKH